MDAENETAKRARQADISAKAIGDDPQRENKFDQDMFQTDLPKRPSAQAGANVS